MPKSGFGSENFKLYLLRNQLTKNFKINWGSSRNIRKGLQGILENSTLIHVTKRDYRTQPLFDPMEPRQHIYLYKNIGKSPQKDQKCQLLHPGSQIYCKTNYLSNGISKIDLSLRKTQKICPKSGFGSPNLQLYLLRDPMRKNFKTNAGSSRKVRNVQQGIPENSNFIPVTKRDYRTLPLFDPMEAQNAYLYL